MLSLSAPIFSPDGYHRFSPSPVIRAAGEYYVWYSRCLPNQPAAIWYASSSDGIRWYERGKALLPGRNKDWDNGEVFNPSIMIANHFYWLFFIGRKKGPLDREEAPSSLGVAFSESPTGPWEKLVLNPILHPGKLGERNVHSIQAVCIIRQSEDLAFFFLGRACGEKHSELFRTTTREPMGPFSAPESVTSVPRTIGLCLWPHHTGLGALFSTTDGLVRFRSLNGQVFESVSVHSSQIHRLAPFREDNFAHVPCARGTIWGIAETWENYSPVLHRFDWPELGL